MASDTMAIGVLRTELAQLEEEGRRLSAAESHWKEELRKRQGSGASRAEISAAQRNLSETSSDLERVRNEIEEKKRIVGQPIG